MSRPLDARRLASARSAVLSYLRSAEGPLSLGQLEHRLAMGASPWYVRKAVKALVADGLVVSRIVMREVDVPNPNGAYGRAGYRTRVYSPAKGPDPPTQPANSRPALPPGMGHS